MLARGYTPRLYEVWEVPLFWHVGVWCAPDRLKNTAGWRLFQLVVVVARRKADMSDYGRKSLFLRELRQNEKNGVLTGNYGISRPRLKGIPARIETHA